MLFFQRWLDSRLEKIEKKKHAVVSLFDLSISRHKHSYGALSFSEK